MRNKLLEVIDIISSFGLVSNLKYLNKYELLEKNLIELYNLYFLAEYDFDETDYPDFDNSMLPDIRANVISNFSEFGWYKIANDITNFDNKDDIHASDAIDDLSDIIIDLLETKWRIENNSYNDGIWHFKLDFETHIKQHILDLLNYITQMNK